MLERERDARGRGMLERERERDAREVLERYIYL